MPYENLEADKLSMCIAKKEKLLCDILQMANISALPIFEEFRRGKTI